MTRKGNWQALLHAFLVEHRFEAFEYGRWDCCLFVGEAVQVMTGVDPAADLRGAYSSRVEARRFMRRCGLRSVEVAVEAVAAEYGMRETDVSHAQRGDLALVRNGRRDVSLGLVSLTGREVLLASSNGIWAVPISLAVRAWHI